ncbi:MAG: hypothetical protein AAB131_02445, partial [Actinomycetota bacterium]
PARAHAPQPGALAPHRPGDAERLGGLRVIAGERRDTERDAADPARIVAQQPERASPVASGEGRDPGCARSSGWVYDAAACCPAARSGRNRRGGDDG